MSVLANFRTRILCEDVRKELGNKRSLMGVFSGDVFVSQFPATLSFAAYFEYFPDTVGQQQVNFSIYFADKKIADMNGELSVVDLGKLAVLDLPRMNLTVTEPGEFRIEVAAPPSPPEVLLAKKVMKQPTG